MTSAPPDVHHVLPFATVVVGAALAWTQTLAVGLRAIFAAGSFTSAWRDTRKVHV